MIKKFLIIGLNKAGKTSLANYIEKEKPARTSSQDIVYRDMTIELPASYIENSWMNNIIIVISQNQALANIFLLDGENLKSLYSPQYAKTFTKPSLGLISKSDLLSEENRKKAKKIMTDLGCDKIIFLSHKTGEGLEDLDLWIKNIKGGASEIYNRR